MGMIEDFEDLRALHERQAARFAKVIEDLREIEADSVNGRPQQDMLAQDSIGAPKAKPDAVRTKRAAQARARRAKGAGTGARPIDEVRALFTVADKPLTRDDVARVPSIAAMKTTGTGNRTAMVATLLKGMEKRGEIKITRHGMTATKRLAGAT